MNTVRRPLARCLLASLILLGPEARSGWAQCPAREMEGGAPDVARLTERASTVVHGTVVSSAPLWIGRTIYTSYEVAVQQTMKGPAFGRIHVFVPGGAIDNVRTVWSGVPVIAKGDEVVFFGKPDPQTDGFRGVGAFGGIIKVERSGEARAVRLCDGRQSLSELFRRIR